jgi:hypothetical protein
MAALHFAVEARSTRWDRAMSGPEPLTQGREGMVLARAIQGSLGSCRIPVREGGIVVGLDDFHRKGKVESTYWMKALETWLAISSENCTIRSLVQQSMAVY